jgi:photosystem II stability/assembly factor-like uncharacterized protein
MIGGDVGTVIRGACLLSALAAAAAGAQEVSQVEGATGEFRGLAARDGEAWASGRGGRWARSTDGGRTWTSGVIPGADSLVLVDVEILRPGRACVLGTGFEGGLARAFRTEDGGKTWIGAYERRHPQVFFDGMAFWDGNRGVAFSDPVDGAFLLARTDDGCRTWTEVPADRVPAPLAGEAGFAASGTAITAAGAAHAWIGTGGGPVARVLRTADGGRNWTAHPTPFAAGPAAGIFGIAFRDTLNGVAAGGNYQDPGATTPNVLRTADGGLTWTVVGTSAPAGVRYGARYASGARPVLVAVGPTGWGYSMDDGASWMAVDTLTAFTVAVSARAVWTAGPDGRVVRFDPAPWLR